MRCAQAAARRIAVSQSSIPQSPIPQLSIPQLSILSTRAERRGCIYCQPRHRRLGVAVGRVHALEAAMTGRELAARIDAWVVSVWAFSRPLLKALEWRDSVLQLRRSSSGAAANYGAAVFARSHADFISKVAIALEEMEESWRWLRLLNNAMDDPPRDLASLIDEARQLTAILAASHQTARGNRERDKSRR
jgi:four helix bundle protein